LKAVKFVNDEQKNRILKKIESNLWILKHKTVGVLGLSFKPDTDDIRFSPSIDIIRALLLEGVKIKTFDPKAMSKAKKVLKGVTFCKDAYGVARAADCLVVMTEWSEFKELDFKKVKKLMKQRLIIDGRNIYDPNDMKEAGFKYIGVGRR